VTILVDANVLSEATKERPNPNVVEWLREHDRELVIDPIVLGELRFGILILPSSLRRSRLETWFDEGIGRLHCLPWEAATGTRWAQLVADLRASGTSMPIKDSMIAATALIHGLAVATRNLRDFDRAGITTIDPFDSGID